jgi:exonuclease VII large subunit
MVTSIAVAATSVLNLLVIYLQKNVMDRQTSQAEQVLEQMRRQTEQSEQALNQMRRQTDQSDEVLEQVRRQTEQADDALRQMQEQQDLMHEQNRQTETIISQMRLEQRAWLGVQTPTIEGFAAGGYIKLHLPVRNSGRTPGTVDGLSIAIRHLAMDEDPSAVFGYVTVVPGAQESSIAPESMTTFQDTLEQQVSQSVFDSISGPNASRALYMVGIVGYDDGLGSKRETRFCYRFEPSNSQFIACMKYNTMQ